MKCRQKVKINFTVPTVYLRILEMFQCVLTQKNVKNAENYPDSMEQKAFLICTLRFVHNILNTLIFLYSVLHKSKLVFVTPSHRHTQFLEHAQFVKEISLNQSLCNGNATVSIFLVIIMFENQKRIIFIDSRSFLTISKFLQPTKKFRFSITKKLPIW